MIRFLVYALIISGFLGSGILTIKIVEGVHLFPFRVVFLLLSYALLMASVLNNGLLPLSHIRVSRYLEFLVVWLLYAILSVLWTADKIAAIKSLVFLFTNITTVLVVVYFCDDLDIHDRVYKLWLFFIPPMAGVGIWNQLTGHQLFPYDGNVSYEYKLLISHMPRSAYRNPNDFATYLSLSVPFLITFVRYTKSNIKRLAGTFTLLLCLYLIVFTFSRINYLAVLAGLIFWFLFLLRGRHARLRSLLFIGIGLGLLAVGAPFLFRGLNALVGSEISTISDADSSIRIRLNLAKNGLLFLADSFGLGVGVGNVEYYMAQYGVYSTMGVTNVHNWWIEILAEYGVGIFVGYVVCYASLMIHLYNAWRRSRDIRERRICEALLMASVIFVPASVASSSVLTFMPQWLLFGFCLSFLNYYRTSSGLSRTS